jgi:hypothetical protein
VADKITIDKAFGLSRARRQKEIVHRPALYQDVEQALIMMSARLSGGHLTAVLQNCSDEQIVEARNQMRLILTLADAVRNFVPNSRKWGLGLKVLSKFDSFWEIPTQQIMLIFLIALKEDSLFQENIKTYIANLRRETLLKNPPEKIELLRSRDPALADVLRG